MSRHPEAVDPALSGERTSLAWRRTSLSAAVLGLLLVRLGLTHQEPLEPLELLVGTGVLCTAAVLAVASQVGGVPHSARRRALVRAVATVLTGSCSATLAVLLIQT